MPLYRRLPKKGFNNQTFRTVRAILNLGELNRFPEGSTVDLEVVVRARLASRGTQELRILGKGKLERRLHVRASHFSKAARAAIEEAGGQAETL
jgi:large subunit ribosomal protein L15